MRQPRIIFIIFIGLHSATWVSPSAFAQKITERSGRKPSFTNWSKGKDFKYITRKSKALGLEKGPKYLFVGEATVTAYRKENGKTFGFLADEATQEAEDNARIELALLLNTYVSSTVEKSTTIDSAGRGNFYKRLEEVSAKARFGGFLKVSSYYQKEVHGKEETYHAWALFSYKAEKLREIIGKYAKALNVPTMAEDIFEEIETSAEDLDPNAFNFN